jgi:hypothetical protein
MTAAMFEDPQGRQLVAEIHERKAEQDAEQHARDVLDATYRRQWLAMFEAVMGVPYGPLRAQRRAVSEVERVAAKYADGGQA